MDSYELLKKIKLTGILFFLIALPVLTAGQARSAYIFAGIGNDGYFPDAQGLSTALLETSGWNGTGNNYLHEDLSGTEIKNFIIGFQTILRPDDTLVWFYSGHGGALNDADGDETASGSFAADDFDETVGLVNQRDQLSDDDLGRAFSALTAATGSRIITIFDSCYAGGFIGGTSDLNNVPGLVFLGSSAEDEDSYRYSDHPYSIFTQGLIDGLKNLQADSDENGILLAEEWFDFAADYTLGMVNNQHPVFRGDVDMILINQTAVPLPDSLWLLGLGIVSLMVVRRSRQVI
jgi:hypothetical protein